MKFLLISVFIFVFIPTIQAKIINNSAIYCLQYEKLNITVDTDALKQLDNNQYINKEFKNFSPDTKLDYYIRYFHIARGLCYYNKDEDIKEVNEIGEFINAEQQLDIIRYDRTVNCYYMYHKILKPEEFSKIKPPCQDVYVKFFNSIFYFLSNDTLCPYPQDKNRVSLGDNDAVYQARNNYLSELKELYDENIDKETNDCEDPYNEEIFYCGYSTLVQKNNYCFNKPRAVNINYECCNYKSLYQRYIEIDYSVPIGAIIGGIATTFFFLLIGMYFSYYYIREIKNQKSIMETIAEQEKMYQSNSRKQMLELNGSTHSSNYSLEGYHSNSSSYNNIQQILPPDQHHSLPLSSNASPQVRPIRSPQPLPVSPADISNIRPNMNNTSIYVNDRPASVISSSSPSVNPRNVSLLANRPTSVLSSSSPNVNSRLSSLSNRRSSIDISSHLNTPEGPRPNPTRPVSPRPQTPKLSINGSPRPTTPINSNTPLTPGTPTTPSSLLPPLALTLPSELDVPYIIDETMKSTVSHNTK